VSYESLKEELVSCAERNRKKSSSRLAIGIWDHDVHKTGMKRLIDELL
jgi:hypothetical protein